MNQFATILLALLLILSTGGRRFSEGTSADREIQRTLMELLNQMDGFDSLGQVEYLYHVLCLVELCT
jgi:ATP-dependent 26S proteasome regulatory subunit